MSAAVGTQAFIPEEKTNYYDSKYKHLPITSSNGAQNVTIGGAQSESNFELPADVYNLSQSYLRLQIDVPAAGQNNYNRLHVDNIPMIQQIRLFTNSGQEMCNLQYANRYTKVVLNVETPYEDVSVNVAPPSLTDANAGGLNYITGLMTSGVVDYDETNEINQAYPAPGKDVIHLVKTDAANGATNVKYFLPMTLFKNTIF